jgi:hypothetical protein
MSTTATPEAYQQIEQGFLEHNQQTKSFYHDLIHKKLHMPYPDGDRAQIDAMRKTSAMTDVEFSVREELGTSYRFPPYERHELDGEIWFEAQGMGRIDDMFNPDGPRAADWPAARREPDSINYKRAKTEYNTIVDFQNSEALRQAKPGEVFVWTSPTVYDIHLNPDLSLEQKKQLLDQVCYGFHSFIFTYTVLENGDLQPQVHSTYFNPNGLRRLYAKAYGEDKLEEFPEDSKLDLHLLGKMEKLPASVEDFQAMIRDVEAEPDTQFELPEDIRKHDLEAHTVDDAMSDARPLAEYYYFLQKHVSEQDLRNKVVQNLIDTAFQNWRKTAYARLGGGDPVELKFFRDLQQDALESLAYAQIAEIRRLTSQTQRFSGDQAYMPDIPAHVRAAAFYMDQLAANTPDVAAVATGCGIGSGFAAAEGTASLTGFTTTYEGANAMLAGWGMGSEDSKREKKLKCGCPCCSEKAGHKVEVVAIIANGKITCPECKTSAPYKC